MLPCCNRCRCCCVVVVIVAVVVVVAVSDGCSGSHTFIADFGGGDDI